MGERDEAGRLELVGGDEELIQGGRRRGAGLLEHLRVDPQPVDPVHVDRHGHVVTVVLHGVRHLFGQQRIPFAFGGDLIQLGEQTQRSPLLDIRPLDLRGRGRVTGHGAGLQHGHGGLATTTGNGEVLPAVAFFHDEFLQGIGGALLATGSPPVQDFHFSGEGGQREQRGEGNDSGQAGDGIHGGDTFLFLWLCKSVLALACSLTTALKAAGNKGIADGHGVVTNGGNRTDSSLSLWERVGVRDASSCAETSCHIKLPSPPAPLPEGEG
ncbi:hypothetical protein D9M69_363180 [compost metagenome]